MPGFGNWSRKNENIMQEKMAAREPFKFGSISGEVITLGAGFHGFGQLDTDERKNLDESLRRHEVTYIVYSFSTPIAWVTQNGEVIKVQRRFSQSTTGAQRLVSLYL